MLFINQCPFALGFDKNTRRTDISPENNLSASDHYGVVAEVDFIK